MEKTVSWYVVHTRPKQELIALTNLQQQAYECYLPQMSIERIRRRKAEIVTEPMFPRYLGLPGAYGNRAQPGEAQM